MPQFQTTRRVQHSAQDMLKLVADVEQYSQFLPYCLACSVMRRSTTPDGQQVILATMTVGYGPMRESFVSRVTVDEAKSRITVQYVDGPFKRLDNRWTFRPQGEANCDVDFYIDYAFKSRTLELLAGSVFERLFRKMADAFIERADNMARGAAKA